MQSSVEIKCPNCSSNFTVTPWDAKEYDQDVFNADKVPTELAMELEGQVYQCFNCKTRLQLSTGVPEFVSINIRTF